MNLMITDDVEATIFNIAPNRCLRLSSVTGGVNIIIEDKNCREFVENLAKFLVAQGIVKTNKP